MMPTDWIKLVRNNWAIILVVPLVCTSIAALACIIAEGSYSSRASLYIIAGSNETTRSQDGLSAAHLLTLDVMSIIESDRVKNDAIKALELDSLEDYRIESESKGESRLVTITVKGPSSSETPIIANQIAESTRVLVRELMDVDAARIIEYADEAEDASKPVHITFVIGILLASEYLAFSAVVLKDIVGAGFKNSEEVESVTGLPVLGHFPQLGNTPLTRLRPFVNLEAQSK